MRWTIVVLGLVLAGCGAPQIAANLDAKANYRASSNAYRECLVARGEAACGREKAIMDADERQMAATGGTAENVNIRRVQ